MPTVISELTGEEVDTASAEWRHECECAWLLANKPTRADKHLYLYGVEDRSTLIDYDRQTGRPVLAADWRERLTQKRPLMRVRSLEAADRILADAKRLYEKRQQGTR